MPIRLSAALIAEFVGTFALCFVGILAIHHSSQFSGGLLLVALAHGLTLATMISATLQTSGGHLNPAVTLGFIVTGKIKPAAGAAYILVQCLAGVIAGFAVYAIAGGGEAGARVVLGGTPTLAGKEISGAAALLAELIATFFLVFAVWGSAADPRARNVGGFAIGLTLTAGILAIGPITGGAINPARAFGPAVVASLAENGSIVWRGHWVYWVGPMVGGAMAALIYHLVLWPRDPARGFDAPAVDVPETQRP